MKNMSNFTMFQAAIVLLLVCSNLCKADISISTMTPPSVQLKNENSTQLKESEGETSKEVLAIGSIAIRTSNTLKPVIEKVYLWTINYKRGQDPEVLNITDNHTLLNSSFVSGATTFIFVHDFASHGLVPWITETKDKLLKMLSCNVLSVNWQAGNVSDNYTYYNVIPRVSVAGNETAMLLSRLHALKQQSLDTVHLVGKGLGAHVAGAAARNSGGLVGRVTGLDPVGPGFETLGPNRRLDKSDAAFVDVIHTNGCNNPTNWMICFGIVKSIGHVDFYPNDGQYQPACDKASKHDKRKPGCDHDMAPDYFRESLEYGVTSTQFLARPAKNYHWYIVGPVSCGSYPQYMGYHASPSTAGKLFLTVNKQAPYAQRDQNCSSVLAHYLANVSSITAISLCVLGGAVVLLPMGVTIVKYLSENTVIKTPDYSRHRNNDVTHGTAYAVEESSRNGTRPRVDTDYSTQLNRFIGDIDVVHPDVPDASSSVATYSTAEEDNAEESSHRVRPNKRHTTTGATHRGYGALSECSEVPAISTGRLVLKEDVQWGDSDHAGATPLLPM